MSLVALLQSAADEGLEAVSGDPIAGFRNITLTLAGVTPKFVDWTVRWADRMFQADISSKDDKRAIASAYITLLIIMESVWDIVDGQDTAIVLGGAIAAFFFLRALVEGGHAAFSGFLTDRREAKAGLDTTETALRQAIEDDEDFVPGLKVDEAEELREAMIREMPRPDPPPLFPR